MNAAASTGCWNDKVALVTGGSGVLGSAIAEAFAAAGAKVVIAARRAEVLQQTAARLQQRGYQVLGIPADLTQPAEVDALLSQTLERFGRLDVLVNNAGRSMRRKVLDTTADDFRELLDLNLLAAVRCTRRAAPHLLQRRGHVVNISSLAGKSSARWMGAYPASKFALSAYTQQLRLELGPQGLHVLLVCPGPIVRDKPPPYAAEDLADLPESARRPGAGVKAKAIEPEKLARAILKACQRRKAELIYPPIARLLFAVMQLSPRLGDFLVRRTT